MTVEPDVTARVAERLRATKRFDRVDVMKRYASLTDPTQIVVVVLVDEGAVSIQRTGDPDNPTRVVRRRWPNLLFFPLFSTESGYGVTYGARLTHPEPAGRDSRISFPMTWGGRKRIAAEFEKRLPGGWITRVEAGGSASRRVNPLFDANDDRVAVWFRPERQITPVAARPGADRLAEDVIPIGVRPVHQPWSRSHFRHPARSLSGSQRRLCPGDEKPARLRQEGRGDQDRARGPRIPRPLRSDDSGREREKGRGGRSTPRQSEAAVRRPLQRPGIQDRHGVRRFAGRGIARAEGAADLAAQLRQDRRQRIRRCRHGVRQRRSGSPINRWSGASAEASGLPRRSSGSTSRSRTASAPPRASTWAETSRSEGVTTEDAEPRPRSPAAPCACTLLGSGLPGRAPGMGYHALTPTTTADRRYLIALEEEPA